KLSERRIWIGLGLALLPPAPDVFGAQIRIAIGAITARFALETVVAAGLVWTLGTAPAGVAPRRTRLTVVALGRMFAPAVAARCRRRRRRRRRRRSVGGWLGCSHHDCGRRFACGWLNPNGPRAARRALATRAARLLVAAAWPPNF